MTERMVLLAMVVSAGVLGCGVPGISDHENDARTPMQAVGIHIGGFKKSKGGAT